ncbi:MAG: hypothetical protein OMM_14253, partial [Candidatus Magnetoglobus multicellularis str. Araruama]
DWSIVYTWKTDDFSEDASFYVLSPSGTKVTIASEEPNGTYTVTSNSFYGEPANGKWRLWIEDSYGDGGCGAVNITMSIVPMDSYLTVSIPENTVENMESITGTVFVKPIPEKDLIVNLFSSNPGRLSVQLETIIEAGKDSASFSMSIADDQLLNGSSDIQIMATSSDYYSSTAAIIIDDNESALLSIILPDSAINGDKIEGQLSINRPLDSDTNISLLLNVTDVSIHPETILMPAGLSEVTFDLSILGNPQTITITAFVANWTVYSDTINIIPAMISGAERRALIDLYNSTGGDNWSTNENWLGERGTECSWYGVSCDTYERYVEKIL